MFSRFFRKKEQNEFDPDEALRVTQVQVMLDGDTYNFRVSNNAGVFRVMLAEHTSPGAKPHEVIQCKHASPDNHHTDPCASESRNLKDATRSSIAIHRARFHFLREVK